MRLKEGFIKRNIAGKDIAVATGDLANEFNGMIKLNETASFIWDQLSAGVAEEADIVSALTAEYNVTAEQAQTDVACVVDQLRSAGILE